MSNVIAGSTWNLDDVLRYLQETGKADIEIDDYGNVQLYTCLHEDLEGNLCEGNLDEEGVVHV